GAAPARRGGLGAGRPSIGPPVQASGLAGDASRLNLTPRRISPTTAMAFRIALPTKSPGPAPLPFRTRNPAAILASSAPVVRARALRSPHPGWADQPPATKAAAPARSAPATRG